MRAMLLVVMLGCAGMRVDHVTLATSTALLLCDGAQTVSWARASWPDGRSEANPIMGSTPSVRTVATYSASVIVLNALLWYATPRRWRIVPSGAVTAVQLVTVADNTRFGAGVCGLGERPGPHTSRRGTYDPVLP